MRKAGITVILVVFTILTNVQAIFAQEQNSTVVQAVLFYSPTCPHCHDVIEDVLPPLKEQYGDQLQLLGIDTSKQTGAQLYEDTQTALAIPRDRVGVPTMVVGEVVLVGSAEIPEQLPGLIEEGLARGGIGWPAIPGLEEAVPDLPSRAGSQNTITLSEAMAESGEELMAEAVPNDLDAPPEDPIGNTVGWIVMLFMILALIYTAVRLIQAPAGALSDPLAAERISGWSIPLLALAGLAIALYLAYVEITHVAAVCGPVGECNIVQSSPYAQILGIPVAILGTLFYMSILGLWLLLRMTQTRQTNWAPPIFLALAILGVLFSIYLTALELLVINAVCAWCLSSAVITTLLLLISITAFTKSSAERKAHGAASHAS